MSQLTLPLCYLCKKNRTSVYGARFCSKCYYPGLDSDYNNYLELKKEGHSSYQAKILAGLSDPD